jgi:hypothetical protein
MARIGAAGTLTAAAEQRGAAQDDCTDPQPGIRPNAADKYL